MDRRDPQPKASRKHEPHLKSSAASIQPFKPLYPSHSGQHALEATDLPSKLTQLRATIAHTEQQLTETLEKFAALPHPSSKQLQNPTSRNPPLLPAASATANLTPAQQESLVKAQGVLDRHIKLLSQYNELKDAGMMLLGVIAEREGKRVGDVMVERGLKVDD